MANGQTRKDFLKFGAVSAASLFLGSQSSSREAIAQTPSTDHPNVVIVQRYYQAYGRSDLAAVREIFAPDITWTIPGHHPLAGTKRGVDEVLAFFDQLAKAQFRAEVLFLGGNDNYVVDVHRGWSNLEQGENIDELWSLLFRIENSRIAEAINFPGNQHVADAFFWKTYDLKPIPDRLV
ncbi:nuclear transport factor 2 family protein [Oculatella sp. FACHB-28]|uniref:nuclear transport factor 2 family protein n=1 Tax=Oculatella sp. FACHB-28 TaxID=2692845 RepID=UPI00168542C2|nr:nuclear transport factor 2 family protein [Oculatella sp. FACHB-28]MBD2058276.1 nuclear transport factor 2 family protein [Oculatella sp. FACHB-28]